MFLIFQDLILSSNLHSFKPFCLLTMFTDNQKNMCIESHNVADTMFVSGVLGLLTS